MLPNLKWGAGGEIFIEKSILRAHWRVKRISFDGIYTMNLTRIRCLHQRKRREFRFPIVKNSKIRM